MHTHSLTRTHIHTHTPTHTHTYTYTRTHIHTHTPTPTHTPGAGIGLNFMDVYNINLITLYQKTKAQRLANPGEFPQNAGRVHVRIGVKTENSNIRKRLTMYLIA